MCIIPDSLSLSCALITQPHDSPLATQYFHFSLPLFAVDCDLLMKQSLFEDSKTGEAMKSFMDTKMQGKTLTLSLTHFIAKITLDLSDCHSIVPDDLIMQLLRKRLSQLDCVT